MLRQYKCARLNGAAMVNECTERTRGSKVSIFLKEHEQWSAWGFFTLMTLLVMYCTGERGVALLHTPLLGFMFLYILKLSSLYVRRSTAWAITCLLFALSPLLKCHPAVICVSLDIIVLYHVLIWARGKRRIFCNRHFFILGAALGVNAMMDVRMIVWCLPSALLMLGVNRQRLFPSLGMLLAGALIPLGAGLSDLSLPMEGMGWSALAGLLLLIPATVTLNRSRPERSIFIHIALTMALIAGTLMICCTDNEPEQLLRLLPWLLLALLGIALLLHRKMSGLPFLRALRAVLLLCPFITLCLVLLLPLYRAATAPPAAAPIDSAK